MSEIPGNHEVGDEDAASIMARVRGALASNKAECAQDKVQPTEARNVAASVAEIDPKGIVVGENVERLEEHRVARTVEAMGKVRVVE